MTEKESELIERLMQVDMEAIPSYIQGIELSEEQNNFFDRLSKKKNLETDENRNNK